MASTNTTAAQRVFGVNELHEMIQLRRNPQDLLDHLHSDASLIRQVKASVALRHMLFSTQEPAVQVIRPAETFPFEVAVGQPNTVLFPGNGPFWAPFSFRLRQDGPEYRLQMIPASRTIWLPTGESRRVEWFEYLLQRIDGDTDSRAPIVPPAYLAMFLSTHAKPLVAKTRYMIYSPIHRGTRTVMNLITNEPGYLYVPGGKTLRDIVSWIDLFASGSLGRSDVVNGTRVHELHGIIGDPQTAADIERERKWRDQGKWILHLDGAWVASFGQYSIS